MQIKWIPVKTIYKLPIHVIFKGFNVDGDFMITVDDVFDTGCISCFFNNFTYYIPFTFSQIPGEQNDPDLLVLAHQLIEKEIQHLKNNGRY